MSIEWNKIYNEDCIEGMKRIDDNVVDIIIADPPYNIGKDFGNNDDNLPLNEYIDWSSKWINEGLRILKPTGTMFVYGFSEILAHISTLIDIQKQQWLIWHYTNKNVPSLNFWQRSHEAIICTWKDKPIFNRDAVREPYTESFLKNSAGKKRTSTQGRFSSGKKETVYVAHPNGALPRDVFNISTLAGGAALTQRAIYCKDCNKIILPKDRHKHDSHQLIIHPTQKPLDLTNKLIASSRPSENNFKVVIPFVGSGSECLATFMNGGDYIGFEINPDYVLLANSFIKNTFISQNMELNL
jgi:site-specific DNA-methyltransferase (adenine-specific)